MPKPPRSAAYLEADQAVGGDLVGWLGALRSEGLSYREIAGRLRDLGAVVTDESVRNWCQRLLEVPA